MQVLFKIIVTILVGFFLYRLWCWDIDVKKTLQKPIKKVLLTDVIVKRDPMKIYQDGKEVGDVTGEVKTIDNSIIFVQISNTAGLKRDLPFEYQGQKLKITKVGPPTGLKFDIGRPTRMDVLPDVECEMVR